MEYRKQVTCFGIVALLALIWGIGGDAAETKTSFSFRTPFVPTMGYSEFYVAQELYWPKLNLDGKTLPGKGSAAAVQTVAAGSEQMGYSAIASVAAGIQQGMPIKVIAVGQRRDPSGLIFLKDSGIRGLKDIVGKRVGNFPGGSTGPLLRVTLRRAAIDEREVQIVNVVPGSEVPLLLEKKIDALAGFSGAQDTWMRCQGHKADSIPFASLGLEIYGQVVFVNSKWAEQVGDDVVARALLGIIRASMTIKREPDRTLEIIQKLNPQFQMDRFREWASLPTYIRWSWYPDSPLMRQRGWGWIDEAEMRKTQRALLEGGLVEKEIDPRAYYTDKFLQDPRVRQAAMEWVHTPWGEVPDDVKKKCGL